MTFRFDRHRRVASPALAPIHPRDTEDSRDRPRPADGELSVALINNMPDAALEAAERQFSRLLAGAAGRNRVRFHRFSLPSVKRSHSAKWRVEQQYGDIADLGRLHIDGLIVTGAEPNAATIAEEPFWRELTEVIDWAKTHTRSAIWSCLAAHAAVLHLDGIERRRLETKCSGIYQCRKVSSHWLMDNLPSSLQVPHSRLNELRAGDLVACGYQLLTHSPDSGVDIFARQVGSQFIFFQGHPEYEALSLEREYLRDISRFLAGHRETFPAIPTGYFDTETERRLADFERRASAERRPALSAEIPPRRLRKEIATTASAIDIFRNWLGYLSQRAAGLEPGGISRTGSTGGTLRAPPSVSPQTSDCQRPMNLGGRFALKASTPSLKSSDWRRRL